MAFQYAAEVKALKDAEKLRVIVDEKPILLTYYRDTVYAMSDRCPHMKASLYEGDYEEGIVTCKKHHAQIDVETGKVLEKAKLWILKMPTKEAQTYVVKVEDDKIFVLV